MDIGCRGGRGGRGPRVWMGKGSRDPGPRMLMGIGWWGSRDGDGGDQRDGRVGVGW